MKTYQYYSILMFLNIIATLVSETTIGRWSFFLMSVFCLINMLCNLGK